MKSSITFVTIAFFVSSLAGCAGTEIIKTEVTSPSAQDVAHKPDKGKPDGLKIVQSGNEVDISYLCKLKTGEVFASTGELAGNQPLSSVYEQPEKAGPISVTTGEPFPLGAEGMQGLPTSDEIAYRLADLVIGMKEGESRTMELSATDIENRAEQYYVWRMPRVRKRPREMRMSLDQYKQRFGRSPEVGTSIIIDPAVPGHVESVDEKEVFILFPAKEGDIVSTSFGPGHIRETENGHEIVIDAAVDSLIRIGRLVGRVTAVDDNIVTMDFRNPFGREELTCDVKVEKIENRSKEGKDAAGTQAHVDTGDVVPVKEKDSGTITM